MENYHLQRQRMDFIEVFENNAAPNKSMDVRAKQRLSY